MTDRGETDSHSSGDNLTSSLSAEQNYVRSLLKGQDSFKDCLS